MSVFKSDRTTFTRKNAAFMDMVQGRMAADIETALKTKAGMPYKTGNMKSATRHFRNVNNNFRVEVDTAYAAYQEAGARRDGSHAVRHFSHGGTGKGFFRRAINMIVINRGHYISEARRAVGL